MASVVVLAVPVVAASVLSLREAAVLAVTDTLALTLPLVAAAALSPPRGTAGVTMLQPHVVLYHPSHAKA